MSDHILIVDDQRSSRNFLETVFSREGYRVTGVADEGSALLCLETDDVDVMIVDLEGSSERGLENLQASSIVSPSTIVIVISEFTRLEGEVQEVKQGAFDCVYKPFRVDEIKRVVEKALEKKLFSSEGKASETALVPSAGTYGLIGVGAQMQAVFGLIEKVSQTASGILISGELGTGKERVGRTVHNQSKQAGGPFVAVPCGGISEDLFVRELAVEVSGKSTSVALNTPSLFEAADGGTLFLDEVSELSRAQQSQLLRLIQEKTQRSGIRDSAGCAFDVRLISSSSVNLKQAVLEGRFRQDLYYWLNVVEISLPPLRERREDIPVLVRHLMQRFSPLDGPRSERIADSMMQKLMEYDYPGNLGELENIIERAMVLAGGGVIDLDAWPSGGAAPNSTLVCRDMPPDGVELDRLLHDYERALLDEALDRSGGVKKRAAELLGISFRSFRYRYQKMTHGELSDDA